VFLAPLKNEELVTTLLVHDEDFSTYNGQVFVILAKLHSYDLVGLPGFGLEQGDWDLVDYFESLAVMNQYFIHF